MNSSPPQSDTQRPTPNIVARRRAARPGPAGQSPDLDFPVLLQLPDLQIVTAPPIPRTVTNENKKPAAVAAVTAQPAVELPPLESAVAADAAAGLAAANSIPASVSSSETANSSGPVSDPTDPPVPPQAREKRTGSFGSEPTSSPARKELSEKSAETTLGRNEIEPASLLRERRRRREEDLPSDSQSMTKQWATVLILVAVISTSFYLLNRPRGNQDLKRGARPDASGADEVARKSHDGSARESHDNESGEDPEGSSRSGADPIEEPIVPPTLPGRDKTSASLDRSSPTSPLDEVSLVPNRSYPSTDPQRYEFRSEETRNAERNSTIRNR